ncbi:MAG: hypothetical protein NZ927_05635 [Candidatus Calescibacterium sp.]|nr:hypothetical protein [Candidatus Calescibacterium sp.]MCX7734191.1 hypothetical protein [bacterium]MDW8086547.1 hypothetical protein [Candidatus Calescibacterium sp.]
MDEVIEKTKNTLLDIKKNIQEASEQVESNIFSDDINVKLKDIEIKLKHLPELISEIIKYSKTKNISYDKISEIINLFSEVESAFSGFISKLENISYADSKRIESIKIISSNLRSAESITSKGKNIKIKK